MRAAFAFLAVFVVATAARADVEVSNDASFDVMQAPFVLSLPTATNAPPPSLPPQLSGVGLGLQIGFPTAITLKLGQPQRDGFVFGLGAGFGYNRFLPYLSLHGEYQLHLFTLVHTGDLALTGYFAPGLWIAGFGDGRYGFYNGYVYGPLVPFGVGVRGTLGLSMTFSKAPAVELYLELTPALFIFPAFDPGISWSLGFRYYF